jgi:DNA-binding transcriptional MerR regulator
MSSLNQNLQKVLRVLKDRKLLDSTNNEELAKLAGLSSRTIRRLQDEIDQYIQTAPKPTSQDELSVDKKILDKYIETAIVMNDNSKYDYTNILGAIAGFVLRQEHDLINFVRQPLKVINIGINFISLASQVKSRRDTKDGVPIHSKSKAATYLLGQNKSGFVDQLFTRSDNYKTGAYSKSWRLTKLGELVIEDVIEKTIDHIQNVQVSTTHIDPPICASKSRTLLIPLNILKTFSFTSILHVLNNSNVSTTPSSVDVTLDNLSSTDESIGRDYNIFTRLRSDERKLLGYINYDISGGIQIIAFSILYKFSSDPDLFEKYPMLWRYGYEPDYKQQLRTELASALKCSIDDVKALLTAYANGSMKNIDKHDKLKQFAEESDLLRREVISITKQCNPDVLKLAIDQSKKEFSPDRDWMSTEKEDDQTARDKSSVFFFIWTYYEKKIRDSMLSVVNDGIPVHDAIYSQQQLPCEDFEKAVLEQTGFEVKITN